MRWGGGHQHRGGNVAVLRQGALHDHTAHGMADQDRRSVQTGDDLGDIVDIIAEAVPG
jgi:hypothetical protein